MYHHNTYTYTHVHQGNWHSQVYRKGPLRGLGAEAEEGPQVKRRIALALSGLEIADSAHRSGVINLYADANFLAIKVKSPRGETQFHDIIASLQQTVQCTLSLRTQLSTE